MGFAGRVGFDVAQIASVVLSLGWPAMVLMGRVEMAAGRGRVRSRAIALFMNVEAMLPRLQILNIGNHFNIVSDFCERDRAGNLTPRFWLQSRGRLGHILSLRERRKRTEHCK